MLTTAEQMAVAVLKGDHVAAHALADHIVNEVNRGGVPTMPVQRITVGIAKVRVVLFASDAVLAGNYEIDCESLSRGVNAWLNEPDFGPLVLRGFSRMEVYQLGG